MPLGSPVPLRFRRTFARGAAFAATCGMIGLCGCGNGFKLSNSAAPTPSAVKSGPQLGYAWKSQDQTLRPILGVPGSSLVGTSVVTPATFIAGASSSTNSVALLIGADRQVYQMTLPGGTPAKINLMVETGAEIRFSPSGVSALVYVPGSMAASVVTSVSTAPQIQQVTVNAPLLDASISDAGTVAVLLKEAGGDALNVLTAGGSQLPLATIHGPGGLAFAGTSDNLLAADSASNTLTLIRSASTAPSATQLPTSNLLKAPVGVGASLNGRWAVVANSGDSSVVQVDLSGEAGPQRVACPSQPTTVAQLVGNGVFRFTEIGTDPAWIADMTAHNPSMLFIPASQ